MAEVPVYDGSHIRGDAHIPEFVAELRKEFCSVDKEIIRRAWSGICFAIETTKSCLVDHDVSLGRTTRKNKQWAETLEGDIRALEKSKQELTSFLK